MDNRNAMGTSSFNLILTKKFSNTNHCNLLDLATETTLFSRNRIEYIHSICCKSQPQRQTILNSDV